MRQDHVAALHRRVRHPDLRQHPHRRPRHHAPAAGTPRHRDDVPVVRAVAAHDRRPEHRLRACACAAGRRTRSTSAWRRCSRCCSSRATAPRPVTSLSGGQRQRVALGTLAGGQSGRPAARRADVQSRLQGPHRAPAGAAGAAAAHRHHRRLRDARPRGGADARRPHRRARTPADVEQYDAPEVVYHRPVVAVRGRLHGRRQRDRGRARRERRGWRRARATVAARQPCGLTSAATPRARRGAARAHRRRAAAAAAPSRRCCTWDKAIAIACACPTARFGSTRRSASTRERRRASPCRTQALLLFPLQEQRAS